MIRVETVIEDEDSLVQGGVHFYWVPGSRMVLFQEWEHRASGPEWKQVAPDPMGYADFLTYLRECYPGHRIVDVNENFC